MKFISTGLVSGSLLTLSKIKTSSCSDMKELNAVYTSHGVEIDNVISFVNQCGWISLIDGKEISLTNRGLEVVSLFSDDKMGKQLWRMILETYIYSYRPTWAYMIPFGRKEAYFFMQPDEQRCFEEAGLMENPPSQDAIDWWDRISEEIRKEKNSNLEKIGREGEKLTVDYEKQRTGKMPEWKSLDTNRVGYDILSCVDKMCDKQLLLEVKTSKRSLENAKMIISRNEWKKAIEETSRYLFYVWAIKDDKQLAKLSVKDIEPHAPKDQGAGSWKEFEVPYKSFKEKFEMV